MIAVSMIVTIPFDTYSEPPKVRKLADIRMSSWTSSGFGYVLVATIFTVFVYGFSISIETVNGSLGLYITITLFKAQLHSPFLEVW